MQWFPSFYANQGVQSNSELTRPLLNQETSHTISITFSNAI